MGINLLAPTGLSSATLIADSVSTTDGSNDSIATLTKNGGNPVSACLELQSTKGGFLLPRMTTVQRDALNAVNAMQVFNSDTGVVDIYQAGGWASGSSVVLSAAVNVNQASLQGMNAAAVAILGAPGAGKVIIVHAAFLNYTYANATAYTGGGAIALQYGAGVYAAGNAATALASATLLTNAANSVLNLGSPSATNVNPVASATAINAGIYLSNAAAAFTGGGADSNLAVRVWYSIVTAV